MIDNPILAEELVAEIEAKLPMKVIPTKELQKIMIERKAIVPKGHIFKIEKVHYLGDEGGICCGISLPGDSDEDLIVSITHLHINQSDILGKKIVRYQRKRVKKLSRQRAH